MLKINFFDVIYWRTALWRLSLGDTSKLDANSYFDFSYTRTCRTNTLL